MIGTGNKTLWALLAIASVVTACKAGAPQSEMTKDFPAPAFNNKVGDNISVSSLASFNVSGTCSKIVIGIEVSADGQTWSSLPAENVNCSKNGTFFVTNVELPGATKVYARSKGKGSLVSKAVDGKLSLSTATVSDKFNLSVGGGITSGGGYKVKFSVGYNAVGNTGASGSYKVKASSAGVVRGQ